MIRIPLPNAYKFLAPRPVVLVTTVDRRGRINAAPISWITPVESQPPVIAFSISYESDTYHNILETREFVVNLVSAQIRKQMWACGKSLPRGVNELERAGLSWEPSEHVSPPRVRECPVCFECKLEWTHEERGYVVVAGRVVAAHAKPEAVKNGVLNVEAVKPLLHLGGRNFTVAEHFVGL